jgi:ferritin-like metal-binding protein YciE
MVDEAESEELKTSFSTHLEETRGQIRRIEQAFRALGEEPRRRSCKGMEGIIDEGQILAREFQGNTAKDAALVCAAQKVEHYEITSYGCLLTWAKELGNTQVIGLLKENMREEKATDAKLTSLATQQCNLLAARHDTEKRSNTASVMAKTITSGP